MHTDEAEEEILDSFLEGNLRAAAWRELREALQRRLEDLRVERESLDPSDRRRLALARKIAEREREVAALIQEEAVSRFVEDSVRATLARPMPTDPGDEGAVS